MRIQILEKIIFFFLILIALALAYTQIIRGGYYHGQSLDNRIRVVSIDAPRGRILDRNGVVLADNRPTFNINIIPQDIEDADTLFTFLGRVLNKEPKALRRIFNRRRFTPFDPVVIVQDIDRQSMITVEENRFRYPGLVTQDSFERLYPFHETGAHAVGYVGKIDQAQADVLGEYGYTPLTVVGKTGAEEFYETLLEGTAGGRQIEVNNRGQEVRILGLKQPVKGKDIGLTLDQRLQATASRLLGGRPGSIVVMDINNGDVLSLVSSPQFDPNAFNDRTLNNRISEYIRNPLSPLLNRAISAQFPPGSVFKIPVALAAMERGIVKRTSTFFCPGYYMIGKARFGCTHEHREEDLEQGLAHSCNVYFYHVGQMITAPIIGKYAEAFGLARRTGIDLPFEARGNLHYKKTPWYPGDTLNFSIGQGDTLSTPMQLTVLLAAIAQKGIILKPRVLHSIDGKILPQPDLSKRPRVRLGKETWDVVQDGLRQTVSDPQGTAHLLEGVPGVTVWGKTGTAQTGKLGDHAWFAGYLHSAKNALAFCVFLEHGGSSANAVAMTRDLLESMRQDGVI